MSTFAVVGLVAAGFFLWTFCSAVNLSVLRWLNIAQGRYDFERDAAKIFGPIASVIMIVLLLPKGYLALFALLGNRLEERASKRRDAKAAEKKERP